MRIVPVIGLTYYTMSLTAPQKDYFHQESVPPYARGWHAFQPPVRDPAVPRSTLSVSAKQTELTIIVIEQVVFSQYPIQRLISCETFLMR